MFYFRALHFCFMFKKILLPTSTYIKISNNNWEEQALEKCELNELKKHPL